MTTILPLLIVCVICGVIGMAVGDMGGKKNGKTGLALGILLGPLGVVIAAVLPAGAETAQKSDVGKLLIAGGVIAGLMGAGWLWLRLQGWL